MRRFAVKPTFRGWALYFFRGNEQVAYASGEQTVYLEGWARAYSFSRLLRCFPRYWSRVCTAQQGEDVGCDADDPGIFI